MQIHFISGLPRSGSTLLAAILRQNPRFHAAMSGPVAEMFAGLVRTMGGFYDTSILVGDEQRKRVLRAVFEAYYADRNDCPVIFDTNRLWCASLPALAELFSESRMICCVRSPAWILNSFEMHVQRNPFGTQKPFGYEAKGNVYTRVETLMGKDGIVRRALGNLRQAWFGEFAQRMVAVRYESLAQQPADSMSAIYRAIGEPSFPHDFDNVSYEEPLFDEILGLPGFHRISGPVRVVERETILPPDLFRQHDDCFWNAAGQNPRGVTIV
jgi:sulfotransferase